MLSAYLLFGCKNILMSDATRSLLLGFCNRWCLVSVGRDKAKTRGEWLAPSPVWAALRENKPGILCWLIITNKTHNNSFPSPAEPSITHCAPPCLASPATASSWKQRNEFIIHQKGSEQLDRGSHNIAIGVLVSAAPWAWHGSLLTTASNNSLPVFLPLWDHSGHR